MGTLTIGAFVTFQISLAGLACLVSLAVSTTCAHNSGLVHAIALMHHLVRYTTSAGPRTRIRLNQLGEDATERIFLACDEVDDQRALAHSCRAFRQCWLNLEPYPLNPEDPEDRRHTACWEWQHNKFSRAADTLVGCLHVQLDTRKMGKGSQAQGYSSFLQVSVLCGFTQRHLQYILQMDNSSSRRLAGVFEEYCKATIVQVLEHVRSSATLLGIMKFDVHHSRQASFADWELDRLSDFFSTLPNSLWGSLDPDCDCDVRYATEPGWHLVSPSGQRLRVPWAEGLRPMHGEYVWQVYV